MKDIGELLVESIKLDCELMIDAVRDGDTSTSCAFMEGVRVLCQFGMKLVNNNHLKSGDWAKGLKEIVESILTVIKEKFDDVNVAEEALDEVKGFIDILEK